MSIYIVVHDRQLTTIYMNVCNHDCERERGGRVFYSDRQRYISNRGGCWDSKVVYNRKEEDNLLKRPDKHREKPVQKRSPPPIHVLDVEE